MIRNQHRRDPVRSIRSVHVARSVGRERRRVGAFDSDGGDEVGEVAGRCDVIRVVPVDHAACPVDRSGGGAVDSCGPDAGNG